MCQAPDPFAVLGAKRQGVRSLKDRAPDPFAVLGVERQGVRSLKDRAPDPFAVEAGARPGLHYGLLAGGEDSPAG